MLSPEKKQFSNIENKPEIPPDNQLRDLLIYYGKQYVGKLPKEFYDVYPKDLIEEELKKVEKQKGKINDNEKSDSLDLPSIFERIICVESELNNWLGENCMLQKCSEPDDFLRGVDSVAEFDPEFFGSDNCLGLAIDVTISKNPQVLGEKIQKIQKTIREGESTKVKYFTSNYTKNRGEIIVPKFIVIADSLTVKKLGGLVLGKKNKELSQHFIQFQILEEISIQADAFLKYAELHYEKNPNKDRNQVVEKYKNAQKIIEKVLRGKEEGGMRDTQERDNGFDLLKDNISEFQTRIEKGLPESKKRTFD